MKAGVSGMGERIVERLRSLGYWKNGAPEIGRFCQEKGYRPQYVYAWVKNREPGYGNLVRLTRDLETTKAWLMFGIPGDEAVQVVEGDMSRRPSRSRRSQARRQPDRREPGPAIPAQIIDFALLRGVTAKLGQVEGKLDAIFRAFPDQYLWLDAEGRVMSFNGGRTGADGGALPISDGMPVESLVPADIGGTLAQAFRQACAGGEVVSTEFTLRGKSEDRSFEARFVPLPGAVGPEPASLVIVRDVTARRRAEDASAALAQVGRQIAETLDLDEVMRRICSATLQAFAGCAAMIHRLDRDAGVLVCTAAAGGSATDYVGAVTPLGVGVCGKAAAEGRPVCSRDFLDDPAVTPVEWGRRIAASEGYRAVLGVPLRVHGEIMGALGIGARAGRTFAPDEMATVSAFADSVAIALDNARLYREARLSAERLQTLNELNRLVSSRLHVDTVLRELTLAAAKLIPADFAQVGVADEARRIVEMRVDSSERGVPDLPIRVFRYGQSLAGWVAEHRQPLEVRDVFSDPRPTIPGWWRRQGFTSYLGLPIIVDDRLLGLLCLYRGRPFDLGPADRLLLEGLLAQATVALRNAQIHAASEERRQMAETLADMARLLSENLDPDAVACLIVDRVNAMFRTPASTLYGVDPGTGDLVVVARGGEDDYWPAQAETFRLPEGNGASGLAARDRCVVSSPDVFADSRITLTPEMRAALERSGYRAILAVPLMLRGEVIGALSLRGPAGRQFTGAESSLAQAFAGHAAIALDNARRFKARAG